MDELVEECLLNNGKFIIIVTAKTSQNYFKNINLHAGFIKTKAKDRLKLRNGSRIEVKNAAEGTLRGYHADKIILRQPVTAEFYDSILKPIVQGRKGVIIDESART